MDVDMKNLETTDMEITFYGYEVILNEIDREYGHEHRCGRNADSLIRRTVEYKIIGRNLSAEIFNGKTMWKKDEMISHRKDSQNFVLKSI